MGFWVESHVVFMKPRNHHVGEHLREDVRDPYELGSLDTLMLLLSLQTVKGGLKKPREEGHV